MQRNQRSNCQHSLDHRKSKRVPEKHLLIDYSKAFYCTDHNKLWKNLKEVGLLYHLTCPLRNLYADQEATVRTRHGACQVCILSPYLFNVYAEFIIRNARSQAGIKIARKNINNLRHADNTALMAESEEGLKNLFIRVKEEE